MSQHDRQHRDERRHCRGAVDQQEEPDHATTLVKAVRSDEEGWELEETFECKEGAEPGGGIEGEGLGWVGWEERGDDGVVGGRGVEGEEGGEGGRNEVGRVECLKAVTWTGKKRRRRKGVQRKA
jgi:hypothetical protein